ncbi:MAG: RDD family protein [Pyrinomonadaceae bacterium]
MAFCASCGTKNVEGTKFCVSCGAAIAPSPGSWRTGTDELRAQPSPGGETSAPTPNAPPASSYDPNPSATPPMYSTTTPPQYGALYAPPAGGLPVGFGQTRYAEWFERVIAALIDGALTSALIFILFFVIFALTAAGAGVGGEDNPLPAVIFCIGIPITLGSAFALGLFNKVWLVHKRGASIGQGVMNLKVVDAAGNIPPIGTLIIRLLVQLGLAAVPMISIVLVVLDVLWPLWDEKKQTLHDKAAGTFVVKTG